MEQLPSNVKEIFDFINWFLAIWTMVELYQGVREFRNVQCIGSWFRWKAVGYTLIIFVADLLALYFLWKGNFLFAAIRLTMSRAVVLWEIRYCIKYRYARLPDALRYTMKHPWLIDDSVQPYVPITQRIWAWLTNKSSQFYNPFSRGLRKQPKKPKVPPG